MRISDHLFPWTTAAHPSFSSVDSDSHSEADIDLCAELEDSLEELEDGLDVLVILEKAYEKALKSHVRRIDQCTSSGSSRSPSPSDSKPEPVTTSASPARHPAGSQSAPRIVPLFEGSSTALVAILEHPSSARLTKADTALFNPQPISSKAGRPEVSTDGALIRIAHLGDCMGMIVRGEEIVWRTEEMWWTVSVIFFRLSSYMIARSHAAYAVV